MELPPVLIPWSASLQLFPRELAHALGPLLPRLDLLIGPLRAHGRMGDGDPDGFRGIARRGNYERLLLSEWLLAEELPEEFARRAVMGEHGFLELARREPVGARVSAALFDAGPNQLGAPRIVHLAALIVLARRAEAAGARFHWGVLQQPVETLHVSVTASTIRWLLEAKSSCEATDDDLATWREYLGSEIGAEDIWLVGGKRLRALPAGKGASFLQVTDPLEPDANHVTAQVMERGRTSPKASLELPAREACARLLRDPFAVRVPEIPRVGSRYNIPTSNLLFVEGGEKIMARSGSSHLIVYPLPRSSHGSPGKPKLYTSTGGVFPILAAGRFSRGMALVTLTLKANVLQIQRVGSKSDRYPPIFFRLPNGLHVDPPKASDPLAPCFYQAIMLDDEDDLVDSRWLILVNGCLLSVPDDPTTSEEKPLEVKIAAMIVLAVGSAYDDNSDITFIDMDHNLGSISRSLSRLSSDGSIYKLRQFDEVLNAHLGYGAGWEDGWEHSVAVEEKPEKWTVLFRNEAVTLHPPEGDHVVGVVALSGEGIQGMQGSSFASGLIVLERRRRKITVMGRNWTRELPHSPSPILQVAASSYGPDLAYLTASGVLTVYSLHTQAVTYRIETMVTR